jgi:glutamate 5-kinase
MDNRTRCRRIVVKIGSSTLTHSTGRLNIQRIESLVSVISDIKNSGREVVLVSSGAVSAGVARLNLDPYPTSAEEKQAVAAVGQADLIKLYERLFSSFGHTIGQILMTKDVVENETRFKQAKNTFSRLLEMGCIPIVNENDSISIEEIKFGGNDTLSAYVAIVCEAELIINMSDVDGVFTKDPNKYPDAELISRIDEITDEIRSFAGGAGSNRGTGGMITKIKAAQIASEKNIPTLIINGSTPSHLYSIIEGKKIGTYIAGTGER